MGEDTKQITFEGREYTVPVWVEWVARDENGSIFGYLNRPAKNKFEFVQNGESFICIDKNCALDQTDWRESLTKV